MQSDDRCFFQRDGHFFCLFDNQACNDRYHGKYHNKSLISAHRTTSSLLKRDGGNRLPFGVTPQSNSIARFLSEVNVCLHTGVAILHSVVRRK